MERARRSGRQVHGVIEPIPLLGAMPGDESVVTPGYEESPVAVLRRFDPEMAAVIPEHAVRLLSGAPAAPNTARGHLRLVP